MWLHDVHVFVGLCYRSFPQCCLQELASPRILNRPVARLGIEGVRDIFQAGPDIFVTLSKRFWKIFQGGGGGGGGGQNFSMRRRPNSPHPLATGLILKERRNGFLYFCWKSFFLSPLLSEYSDNNISWRQQLMQSISVYPLACFKRFLLNSRSSIKMNFHPLTLSIIYIYINFRYYN